ncbi:MAG TPA: TolC family protein [Myxococcales bacterium]|nr:TolC family protein [Myxococcales bacterium]
MKAARLSLVGAALLAASPATAVQPLEVFLKAAREQNPDAQQASANLAQQKAQALVALGRQLPGVAAEATYSRNQYHVLLNIPGAEPLETQKFNVWSGNVTLRVPLVDLANFQRISAANTNAESSGHTLESTRLAVEGQTVQDYFQLLANIALVATAQNYLEVSRENLRLTQAKLSAGTATRLDVDRAVADVEQQVQQLAAAELQVALAARDLQSTTSIAPDISSAQELIDDLHPEPELATFEANLRNVPSVAAAVSNTRAAEQQANVEKFALLPSLAGTFTEFGTNAPGFQPANWYWQAAITASWSFDVTNVGNIRGSDAAADAARAQELKVRLNAGDAIHRYWQTVGADIAQSRSARAQRDAAVHAADQARVQYRAGTATQLDLLQAQRDAFRAEVTRIQNDANLLNARAQLRLSTGRSLLPQR